jgi:hypothetical protein
MNHEEAARLSLVEKYLLEELPPDLRDQFEEHYFDCQECAADLRATAVFLDTAKDELKNFPAERPAAAPIKKPWFSWVWRPAFVVPALAAWPRCARPRFYRPCRWWAATAAEGLRDHRSPRRIANHSWYSSIFRARIAFRATCACCMLLPDHLYGVWRFLPTQRKTLYPSASQPARESRAATRWLCRETRVPLRLRTESTSRITTSR